MCRGYITRGLIFHSENQFVGSGYQEAYEKESQVAIFKREVSERGTPFVEVGSEVVQYLDNCDDSCVGEMLGRMIRRSKHAAAVFPFQMLSHSFLIGGFGGRRFDPERERESNRNMRRALDKFIVGIRSSVDSANPDALRKASHYIKALEAQIEACDRCDEMIAKLTVDWP